MQDDHGDRPNHQEPTGVYISMRDIYDQQIMTKDSVRDLKTSVDSNKEYIDDMKEHLRPVLTDLEIRMRSLEHWRYSVPGAAVILSFVSIALSAYAQFGGK
jgi:hypothetical protein